MPPTKKTSKEEDHKQSQTKNTQKAEGKLRLYKKSDQIVVVSRQSLDKTIIVYYSTQPNSDNLKVARATSIHFNVK